MHTYVYKEILINFFPNNKILAKFAVRFVSAAAHEAVVIVSIKSFFPILFVQYFLIAPLLDYVGESKSLVGNIFIWYSLSFGITMLFEVYSLEYFATLNCAPTNVSSYLLPKFYQCDCISY